MRLMLVGSSMLLALAVVLYARARAMSDKAMRRDGLSRLRDAVRGRYPEVLVEEVYTYLTSRHGAMGPSYWVRPGDSLRQVYGLVALELEDAILVIADRAGARLPTPADLDQLQPTGLGTVDDLLRFLEPYFRPEVMRG